MSTLKKVALVILLVISLISNGVLWLQNNAQQHTLDDLELDIVETNGNLAIVRDKITSSNTQEFAEVRDELRGTTTTLEDKILSVDAKLTTTTGELDVLTRETQDQYKSLDTKLEKTVDGRTIDTARLFEETAGSVVVVKTKQGLGTGFVYGGTNRVATAYHVVDDGSPITIQYTSGLLGGFGVDATIFKQKDGVAVLELDATGKLTPLKASTDITVGEPIMVIGNPYYMETSVSVGVVSGIGRHGTLLPDVDQIQIDASVAPGLSGGPVLNRKGEVIGVVNSVFEDGSFGFAIPIEYVDRLLGP